MARYRILPTTEQAPVLAEHCRHARYVWNLAVEQQLHWRPGRRAPGYNEQCAQLTSARAEYDWLAAGSQTVQQQVLRDFAQAMRNYSGGTHRRPTWRKAGVHEGFRQVAIKPEHVERLNRRFGRVWVPKIGWVRFRLARPVPKDVKSYRVTRDRSGRWHIAFAHIPDPIAGPDEGSVVGIDRGVVVSAALSTGELLHTPGLTHGEARRLKVLQQRLARAKRGSNRRARTKRAITKLRARETDRRKDWAEKTTTNIARRFDTIRIEALDVRAMTRSARGTLAQPGQRVAQKRGLNRSISRSGWGLLAARLQHKASGSGRANPGRVHVATMLRVRAYRARKPQEPSGLRMRSLQRGAVQRRRERRTQHRRRTGGDSTRRPRH